MKIIAFSGKKQSGKTTAVSDLSQRLTEPAMICVDEISFADYLKEIVFESFVPIEWGWTFRDLDANKDKMLPFGKTVREVLQWWGTDVCRKAWEDIWIESYKRTVGCMGCTKNDVILTADVRFPNEVACVQSLGGHVIRLLRAPFPEDKHKSETALDTMEADFTSINPASHRTFDAIINNREMSIAEQNEAVWKLVKEKKWI